MPLDFKKAMSDPLAHLGMALMTNPNAGQAVTQGLASGAAAKKELDQDEAGKVLADAIMNGKDPKEAFGVYVKHGGDPIKGISVYSALAKQPEGLPSGYRMNPQTGQAEGIPGVDPSYLKKSDPFAMPIPVMLPGGGTGFAPRGDVTKGGYKPIPAASSMPKPPTGYKFGAPDESGTPTLEYIPGGPADPSSKPMTETQGKAHLFAKRMADAESVINDQGTKSGTSLKERAASNIPLVGNYLVSPGYQKLDQAERNFVNATLRQESGAAINQSEFDNAAKQYFPRPGDSPEVIEQKRQNRETAIQGMRDISSPTRGSSDLVPPNSAQDVLYGPGDSGPQSRAAANQLRGEIGKPSISQRDAIAELRRRGAIK